MPPERDIAAFEARAAGYDRGRLGRLHHEIADRAVDLAVSIHSRPRRLLDIGCGTGYLVGVAASRYPDADQLHGIDPAPSMIELAASSAHDERMRFAVGVAERLPYPDHSFDLVVSTTSFDHWRDQHVGVQECARVLVPGGRLVLVDQFSLWLAPTLVGGRGGKARTEHRAVRLLRSAGFQSLAWHHLYAVIIKAVTATT